jgi:hypothetical protein
MSRVNLGVVKVAVFLTWRERVHHDQAKAEYGAVRSGREGEDLSKPILRMTLALQRQRRWSVF